MKTVNGNNKLERQINKAQKYVGIKLVEKTNNYLNVEDIQDKENTYIYFGSAKLVKNGELFVIEPTNWNSDKPLFVKEWATINEFNSYYNGSYIIFKPFSEEDKAKVKELALGADEIHNFAKYWERKDKEFLIKKH